MNISRFAGLTFLAMLISSMPLLSRAEDETSIESLAPSQAEIAAAEAEAKAFSAGVKNQITHLNENMSVICDALAISHYEKIRNNPKFKEAMAAGDALGPKKINEILQKMESLPNLGVPMIQEGEAVWERRLSCDDGLLDWKDEELVIENLFSSYGRTKQKGNTIGTLFYLNKIDMQRNQFPSFMVSKYEKQMKAFLESAQKCIDLVKELRKAKAGHDVDHYTKKVIAGYIHAKYPECKDVSASAVGKVLAYHRVLPAIEAEYSSRIEQLERQGKMDWSIANLRKLRQEAESAVQTR